MTVRRLSMIVAVAACKTTPPPKPTGTALTNADLVALYEKGIATTGTGKSLGSGKTFEITRDGSGNQTGKLTDGDWSDTGTYRVDGDMVCSKWKNTRNGAERCSKFYLQKDGTYTAHDSSGKKTAEFSIKAS